MHHYLAERGSSASGWTCAAPAARKASTPTSTCRSSSRTATTRSSGWRSSRTPMAGSACSARPTAGSPACRWRCTSRRTSRPLSRCTPPTTATPMTATTRPGGNMRMYYDVGTYGGNMVAMNALAAAPRNWPAELGRAVEVAAGEERALHPQVDASSGGRPVLARCSLRPDYDRIECPVFLIAGWRDGYVNTMLRMFTTSSRRSC